MACRRATTAAGAQSQLIAGPRAADANVRSSPRCVISAANQPERAPKESLRWKRRARGQWVNPPSHGGQLLPRDDIPQTFANIAESQRPRRDVLVILTKCRGRAPRTTRRAARSASARGFRTRARETRATGYHGKSQPPALRRRRGSAIRPTHSPANHRSSDRH